MRFKHVAFVLIAFVCILLAVVTLTNYGATVNRMASASAQTNGPSVPAGVQGVWTPASPLTAKMVKASIVGQLLAFKQDNYQKAVFYQSAELRQNFPSTDQFRQMMKTHYPEFANYKTVKFGQILASPDHNAAQAPVELTGVDGNVVSAVYLMIRENGTYRVAGVEGGLATHPVTLPPNPTVS